jgi:SAM-dependent methyltransferase
MDFSQRMSRFLDQLERDIYPEPPTPSGLLPHVRESIARLVRLYPQREGAKVLDIGCGTGFALKTFAEFGLDPTGIALGKDVQDCLAQGLHAVEMNLSHLDFADQSFDIVWSRHSLEHSPFPLFTLMEINRITKLYGLVYIEVPAAESAATHELNPNHYSVLGKSMLLSLFERAGFQVLKSRDIEGTTHLGAPDTYWTFILSKVQTAYRD